MKRAALALAVLSIALLAGCGVGDAGRWIVDTSLRSAYGCSLLISSDQSAANAGDVARRPEPLKVRDHAIVAAKGSEAAPAVIAARLDEVRNDAVEIAAVPISRDISSIRGKGTRSSRAVYRIARVTEPRLHIRVSRPVPTDRPAEITICPSTKGYRG